MAGNSSYSRLSYLALKVEATENTAVIPDVFVPFLSEDITVEYQPVASMPVSATRVKNMRPVKNAIPAPSGNVSIIVEPKTIGHFLRGIYGVVSSGIYFTITGIANGPFVVGETITGGTSTETAVVVAVSAENNYLLVNTVSDPFTNGETLTGGTSGATATLGTYVATRYGHEFKAPQSDLPTFTIEFGYANEAIRYTGVRFNALGSLGQSDNKLTAEVAITARGAFRSAKVTAITTAGAGAKTINVDQTTGLVATDVIKVWRPSTQAFLDFSAAGVKTHTLGSVTNELAFTITNLETALAVGDEIVLAPQTPSYDISDELYWIGGSVALLADNADGLVSATPICIEDFTMVLTNELEPRHCANGTNFINRFPSVNFLKGLDASGSINRTYRDIGQIIKLRENTPVAIQVESTGEQIGSTGTFELLRVITPNAQFNNFAPNISEDALVEQNIEYTAYDSPADGYFHKALLVNTETSY